MQKSIMFVVSPENHAPVFFNHKENVFVTYNKEENIFNPVSRAYIVVDNDISILKEFRNQTRIILKNLLKSRNLPQDVSYELHTYRNRAFLYAHVYNPHILRNSTARHYVSVEKKEVFIDDITANGLEECFEIAEQYLGFFKHLKVRNINIGSETLSRIIGINKYISAESFRDAKSTADSNPRFWVGNSISFSINEVKYFGIVKKFNLNHFEVLMKDGNKKLINYDNETIKIEDIPVDENFVSNLSNSVLSNLQTSLEEIQIYKSKIKIIKIDRPYLSGKDFVETKCAHCPTCGIILRDGNNDTFECVMCCQTAKLIEQDGDVGLFILGELPVKYTFCVDEAKCCSNCGLSNFGKNKAGFKQWVGRCEYTSQVIQPHNLCKNWIPVQPKDFYASMKRNSTNFNNIVQESKKTEINRGIDNSEYKMEDYSIRSEKSKDLSASYEMSYLEWKKKLIEMGKNTPVVEF